MTKVVAVVLNWCKEGDTADCVASLLAQQMGDTTALDVVIVDNASPDRSGDRLAQRFPSVAYLQTGRNLGYAGGNNVGIAWALEHGADWVLVLNNDTVCEPSMVTELLVAAQRHPRAAALAPRIGLGTDPTTPWFAGGELDVMRGMGVHRQLEGEQSCTFLSGCCLLLRRDALEKVGPFDTVYWCYVEDVDLGVRLMRAGYELWYVPTARMVHRTLPLTAPPNAMQIEWRDRNRRRLVRLHFSPAQRLVFSLWFYPTRALHFVRYALSGDVARAKAILKGATTSIGLLS